MASAWAGRLNGIGLGDFNTCLEGTRQPDAKNIPYCTRAIAMLRKAGNTADIPGYQKALSDYRQGRRRQNRVNIRQPGLPG